MIREIRLWPDPVLRRRAVGVEAVDASIRTLVDDLFETMYAAPGVGLAAPQIGVLQRVLVLDTRARQPEVQPVAMINPRIVSTEGGLSVYREGCLSIPGEAEEVERPAVVTVEFLDVDGQPRQLRCEGLLATAAQHEIDHLDGRLYVDFLPVLQRLSMRRRAKRRKLERVETVEQAASTAL
ncbi:MAG TPA: peptide deformylase [Myxococcaceae bacterium]|nr:peptide deformylase [Myxococcaceae bacterium]